MLITEEDGPYLTTQTSSEAIPITSHDDQQPTGHLGVKMARWMEKAKRHALCIHNALPREALRDTRRALAGMVELLQLALARIAHGSCGVWKDDSSLVPASE